MIDIRKIAEKVVKRSRFFTEAELLKAYEDLLMKLQCLLKDKNPTAEADKEAQYILKNIFGMTDIDIEDFAINLSNSKDRDVKKVLDEMDFL